jgi:hypothetical protein
LRKSSTSKKEVGLHRVQRVLSCFTPPTSRHGAGVCRNIRSGFDSRRYRPLIHAVRGFDRTYRGHCCWRESVRQEQLSIICEYCCWRESVQQERLSIICGHCWRESVQTGTTVNNMRVLLLVGERADRSDCQLYAGIVVGGRV